MEQEADFFMTYRAVSNKLKKRFLKKPNVAEAREAFSQLANELNSKGCSHYAGFCCLAMARCEQNMANTAGEVQALIDSARYFLQADQSLEIIHCPNYGEHLNCAKHCFDYATKIFIANDMPSRAASLCEEIGSYYENQKRYHEAISLYQRAAELCFQNPFQSILIYKKVSHLKILMEDYHGALLICTELLHQICDKGPYHSDGITLLGRFAEMHCECEILTVLLLMFLNPHPLKVKPVHSQVLQKYTWTDKNTTTSRSVATKNGMDGELFILLQSLVLACLGRDISSMRLLQRELRPYFTPVQEMLLENVIGEYSHPKGLGY